MRSSLAWIFGYIKEVRWTFALGMFFMLLDAATQFILIGVQKFIIDDVFVLGRYEELPRWLIVFGVCIVVYFVSYFVSDMSRLRCRYLLQVAVARDVMLHLQRMPARQFHEERTAALVNYFTSDIDKLSKNVMKYIPWGLYHTCSTLFLIGVIGYASLSMLAVVLVLCVAYLALGYSFGPRLKQASKKVQKDRSDLLVHIEEGISSSREVIAFHRMEEERKNYDRKFASLFTSVMQEGKLLNKQTLWSDPLRWGVDLTVLAFGGYLVLRGSMSIGLFVVTYQFATRMIRSMSEAFELFVSFSALVASVERIRRILDGPQLSQGSAALNRPIESLSFQEVTFQFQEDQPIVLNRLQLAIPIGSKSAIVGTSGGGKSTIAQLLLRTYEPNLDGGVILVNGVPLQDIDRKQWMSRIGIVFQEPYLFPDTILHNVRMHRDCSLGQVKEACRLAEIDSFISSLPQGYETEVGERGILLSGGQRQRLAIARALLANPDILILDEATSALDLETERRIQGNLDLVRAVEGKTTIVIAHRLSTVANAAQLFVLDQGSLAEQGTHNELLERDGIYKKLVWSEREKDERQAG